MTTRSFIYLHLFPPLTFNQICRGGEKREKKNDILSSLIISECDKDIHASLLAKHGLATKHCAGKLGSITCVALGVAAH